ncbi:MAG: AI-2E family transporter, partial [Burkholderiaceae bacterium]|nr:AI-2E family transporter [Burkholderiaceae bacterium]
MTASSAEPLPPTAPGPAPEPAPTFAPPASPTQPANPAAETEATEATAATAATAATSPDHTPASPAPPPDAGALQPGISDIPYGNPLTLHMPVDVRNMSLALLALFAGVALLHWASAVFIPIMLSLLLTTALRPAVDA